jgi:hypothetical protein
MSTIHKDALKSAIKAVENWPPQFNMNYYWYCSAEGRVDQISDKMAIDHIGKGNIQEPC